MNEGLWYLLRYSLRGSLLSRLRQFRQVKYWMALGGLVLYFGILILPALTTKQRHAVKADWGGLAMAGMLLFSFALSWIFQGKRSGLGFTEAETELLFSAPLTRRELLNYRLLKVQPALLLSTGFVVLFTSISWRYPSYLYAAFASFLLFNLLHIQGLLAVVLCGRWRSRWYAWPLRLGIAGLFALPGVMLFLSFPGMEAKPEALKYWLNHLGASGGGPWMAPWVWIGKLPFVTGLMDIVPRVAAALGLWYGCYALVLRYGVGFEERELQWAKMRAQTLDAVKRGRLAPIEDRPVRPAWFALASEGALWRVIAWKNFTSVTRNVPWTLVIFLLVLGIQIFIILAAVSDKRQVGTSLASMTFGFALLLALLGSQFVKEDLREDLLHLELIKSFPLSSLNLIRGELYGATAVVTLGVYGFLLLFVIFALGSGTELFSWFIVVLMTISAMLIFPALTLVGYLIDNAIALLFPAWVLPAIQAESQHVGFEQIGRGVVNLFLKFFSLAAFSFIPGLFMTIIWVVSSRFGYPLLIPVGAALFAFVIWIEVEMGMLWLAQLLEQLDPGEEETR